MLQVPVTLTFNLLTPKSLRIIFGSWPSIIPRKVYLSEISLKLKSGRMAGGESLNVLKVEVKVYF